MDTTAAVQDLRQKREVEVGELKKRIEEESKQHEAQIQDVRHKHAQQIDQVNEQMDQIKKVCMVLFNYVNLLVCKPPSNGIDL